MLSAKRPAGRFSLLLLDENEFYVREFVATCTWPEKVKGNWHLGADVSGQLRLCTKSLFFEPDDFRIPIVRLPFEYLEQLEGVGKCGVSVEARSWSKMKASAADEPYVFEKGLLATWRFDLTYAALADFMNLTQQMLVSSRLSRMEQESFLEEFVTVLEGSLQFDPGHLRSPSTETVTLELPAFLLSPLVRNSGRLAVTPTRLYFQPAHNISGDTPVMSHALAAVAAVARRRSALRDVGLEVFFVGASKDSSGIHGPVLWDSPSAFFAFGSKEERDRAVEVLMQQPALGTDVSGGRAAAAACGSILEAGEEWLGKVTAAWQRGRLSNYDYLLYCNLAAGRSFNDLTQYPVFPWVLSDYRSPSLDLSDPGIFRDLSKPVGALSLPRLRHFRERFRELAADTHPQEPPFLYGTHYSCPGYTLFWLVRSAPAHMLRLQNGRFDAPDRLFCSIAEAWDSVLSNPTDVKELIPEFFTSGKGEFLKNSRRLALGSRQDGRVVGDVELPPWAGDSPERFLATQRAALESPFVSANLRHWIDLIFGVKQRGKAAEGANNVFRHLTYEGSVDLTTIDNRMERASMETAINEFGQCPRQIFRHPHPARLVCPPPPELGIIQDSQLDTGEYHESLSLALVAAIRAATDPAPEPVVEVPTLLQKLDVIHIRSKEEEEEGELLSATSGTGAQIDANVKDSEGVADKPQPSLFASKQAGIMGRFGASGRLASSIAGSLSSRFNSLASFKESAGKGDKGAETTAESSRGSGGGAAAPDSVADVPQREAGGKPCCQSTSLSPTKDPESASNSLPRKRSGMLIDPGSWGPNVRSHIQERRVLVAGSEAINGVALAPSHSEERSKSLLVHAACHEERSLLVHAACHDGFIRIFDVDSGYQTRAAKLGSQPLTSIACMKYQPTHIGTSNGNADALCGSYDGRIYSYSVGAGVSSGSFDAHSDAVSCIETSLDGLCLATASWDCSFKIWSIAEGRRPWESTFPQPLAAVTDLPGGVWAVSISPDDSFSALVGTEDGCVVSLDFRQPMRPVAWQCTLSEDYIGGVCQLVGGNHSIAACADGSFALLDARKGGAVVSVAACGTPLRCCLSDGSLAMAGGENGGIAFWDVGQQLGRVPAAGPLEDAPGLDGLYRPLQPLPASPVNALGLSKRPGTALKDGGLCLASGHEGGVLRIFWAFQ